MYEELKRVSTFSEKEYVSLDELKERFEMVDVSQTWDRIKEYRSLFRYDLSLKNLDRYPYYLTLNNNLLSKASNVERDFYKLCARVSALSKKGRAILSKETGKDALRWVSDHYGLGFSDLDLSTIYDKEEKNDDPKTRTLENYASILKKISNMSSLELINILTYVNDTLLGNPSSSLLQYRTVDYSKDEFQCPKDKIEGQMRDLLSFMIGEDQVSFLLKIIAFIYEFEYLDPCSYFSLESACLVLRAYISDVAFKNSGEWFPMESLVFGIATKLKTKAILSLNTSDLTYYALGALDVIQRSLEMLKRRVGSIEENDVKEDDDIVQIVDTNRNFIGKKKFDSMSPNTYQYGDGDVYSIEESNITMASVPSYTGGKYPKEVEKGKDEIDRLVQFLIEKHPVMKEHVAHFYLTHKTIGSFYTIGLYQSIEGVAYETARTSMDLLVNLGFYKKSKTAKKFIYTPIPRNGGIL